MDKGKNGETRCLGPTWGAKTMYVMNMNKHELSKYVEGSGRVDDE